MKPAGWPRYMVAKTLANRQVAYYWAPPTRDLEKGCALHRQPLGSAYADALEKAGMLNKHLDAWREAINTDATAVRRLRMEGTLAWLVAEYQKSKAWNKVSARSRPSYERSFRLVTDITTTNGQRLGNLPVASISARAVDKIYEHVKQGQGGRLRLRTANIAMNCMARAWDVVARLNPNLVASTNPFRGIERDYSKGTTVPATREHAYALHNALVARGELHLAAVPLICFEWHQRPENVLAGHLTWTDYCPAERPHAVRIQHHKTGEMVWIPLVDGEGRLFPELQDYLDSLPRLGVPIVLLKPTRSKNAPPRPFKLRDARARIRKAVKAASLPLNMSLAACRHGGLTELGDAEITEQGVMALSGHKTPQAARLYVKRTEAQRMNAARRRRIWVETGSNGEQVQHESRNGLPAKESE